MIFPGIDPQFFKGPVNRNEGLIQAFLALRKLLRRRLQDLPGESEGFCQLLLHLIPRLYEIPARPLFHVFSPSFGPHRKKYNTIELDK